MQGRECHAHAQTADAIVSILNQQLSLVQLTYFLHDGQADAKALVALLCSIKSLCDVRQFFGDDACARVDDIEAGLGCVVDLNMDAAIVGGVGEGIFDDVFEQNIHHLWRAGYSRRLTVQLNINGCRVNVKEVRADRLCDGVQVDGSGFGEPRIGI